MPEQPGITNSQAEAASLQVLSLLDAAKKGDFEKVRSLLRDNSRLVFLCKDNGGNTPLIWAAFNGHKEVAELLLTGKAEVNAKAGDGTTPLIWAAKGHHKEVAELLLTHKAEVDAKANDGWTALHWASANGHKDIAELLLAHKAEVNDKTSKGNTPLHLAATNGHKDIAELLLAHKAEFNAKENDGCTPLHWASANGHKGVAELLLTNKADVNAKTKDGWTPMHSAAANGRTDVAQFLLTNKAEINAKTNDGVTPLIFAAENGHKLVVECLLASNAEVNAKNNAGGTSLLYAAMNGHKDVVGLLLAGQAEVNAKSTKGNTPLQMAANKGHRDVVEVLLANKAEVNAKQSDGWTALHFAASSGHTATAELLLARGVEVNAKNNNGNTPLHLAADKGHKEVAELLLTNKADLNGKQNEGWTALHFAASSGHTATAELLLARGAEVNAKNNTGQTPLIWAAQEGHKGVAELLLANQAEVNVKTNKGNTPLHLAAEKGRKEVAELLLTNKAEVNTKNNDGWTPLHFAASSGHRDVAELLLARKAEVNAKSNDGQTPLFWAKKNSHKGVVELLLKADQPEAQNLIRWKESEFPRKWVADHRGQWTRSDWLDLLEKLKCTEFWPMEPDAIASVLEAQKKALPSAAAPVGRAASTNSKPLESTTEKSTDLASLLKESAHPGLYHQNGFRVLELPVEASVRDLTKRRQIVEAAAANGLPVPAGSGRILPLNPSPDAFATREAVQRLTDPERRLVDEFFWFWAHQVGSSGEDAALRLLCQANDQAAEQIWRKQEQEQSQALVSTHNLAVLHHLRALEFSERELERSSEPITDEIKYAPSVERAQWEEAFKRWVILLREEGFWSRLTARIRELDDPRLTTGTARRIRAGLPLTLLLINAQIALKAAEKNNFDLARHHIAIMRASSFDDTLCDSALSLATEPIRTRLKSLSKSAVKEAHDSPEKANETAGRLLEQSDPLLNIIDCLLPEHHAARGAVHDDVTIAAMDSAIAFGNKTRRYRESMTLYEAMLPIPASQSAKERLKTNYEIIKRNVAYDQCFFCKKNDRKDGAEVEVKMHGDVQRIPIPNGVRTTWRHIAVKLPRCSACKELQHKLDQANLAVGWAGFLTVAQSIIALILTANGEWGWFVLFLLGAIGAGYWWTRAVKSRRPLKGAVPSVSHKEYPQIKELLAEGWTWGASPNG